MTMRYSLTGPEPPPTVRRIAVGPIHSWRYVWRRLPCKRKPYVWHRPAARWWSNRQHGRAVRWASGCTDEHYHWWNTDKSRPWSMLTNRSSWTHGYDADAAAAMHRAYRRRHR